MCLSAGGLATLPGARYNMIIQCSRRLTASHIGGGDILTALSISVT